jgi:diguanylate cyclase (GGDEF)-like protein
LAEEPLSAADVKVQFARMRRRLERERAARREAESIAEHTTRGLYEEVAVRTRELESIVEMGRDLAQAFDDRRFADRIARHIAAAVEFDECGIFEWDQSADTVTTAGYHPASRRSALDDSYDLAEYPETRRVLVSRELSITDPLDPTADPSELAFLQGLGGTLMCQLPMNVGGRTIGTVELISLAGKVLQPRQVALAQTMANEAGVMLENARLYAQVRHQAFHDHLTGLPNRALLGDRMEHALERGRSSAMSLVGLLFVDIDDFKVINDSSGHEFGDRVLIAVGDRLRETVRAGDTVARFSGDEFAILLEDLPAAEDAHLTAGRVVAAFGRPFTVGDRTILLSVSVGVDVADAAVTSAEDLVRNADFAMYAAKSAGKTQHSIYEASAREAADHGTRIRADIRGVVQRGELRLHYQPIVTLADGRVRGFEALVRWQHPTRGLLGPAAFVPIAEASGAIVEIGDWVLDEACSQLRAWQRLQPELTMSVNVSGRQLQEGHIVDRVERVLRRTKVDPASLILEMTETVLVADQDAESVIERLKQLGVRLALDDFGTGYASISYLRRFPINILKIDREFTDAVETRQGSALFAGIAQLGKSLGLDLVAEGIERREQVDLVRLLGCELGQGFLFARPVPADEALKLIGPRAPRATGRRATDAKARPRLRSVPPLHRTA